MLAGLRLYVLSSLSDMQLYYETKCSYEEKDENKSENNVKRKVMVDFMISS